MAVQAFFCFFWGTVSLRFQTLSSTSRSMGCIGITFYANVEKDGEAEAFMRRMGYEPFPIAGRKVRSSSGMRAAAGPSVCLKTDDWSRTNAIDDMGSDDRRLFP
jgi:hypothetical protein